MNQTARSLLLIVWAFACSAGGSHAGAPPELSEVLKALPSGLVVHLGAADASLVLAIAGKGPYLTQALALTPAKQEQIRGEIAKGGRLGQVSVRLWSGGALPYGADMIDLLVVDSDGPGGLAPSGEEVLRVLVPKGVAYVGKAGAYTKVVKPADELLGDWTHWNADACGTNATPDRRVGPSASLRYHVTDHVVDMRLTHGMLIQLNGLNRPSGGKDAVGVEDGMMGRSAFNGVPCWTLTGGMKNALQREAFVAGPDRVVWFPKITTGPAAALDPLTGAELVSYAEGVTAESAGPSKGGVPYVFNVLTRDTLFQAKDGLVVALDARTGRKLWSWTSDKVIRRLVADADGQSCYGLEAEADGSIGARWRSVGKAFAIVCLKGGKLVWRTEVAAPRVNDIAFFDNQIYAYTSGTNMDPPDAKDALHPGDSRRPVPRMFRLNAADGRMVWRNDLPPIGMGGGSPWLNNIVVRNDGIWGSPGVQHFSRETGVREGRPTYDLNFRCVRSAASAEWLLFGFNVWYGRDGTSFNVPVARGDCAQPAYLGMGGIYVPNNIVCNCLVQLHGLVALDADPTPEPIPDAGRLEAGPGPLTGAPGADQAPPKPFEMDWSPSYLATWLMDRAPTVSAGGYDLVVDTNRNRLEARQAGKVVWTFVADGRIYSAPLVDGPACYVSSADGTVTCLDVATGRARWRFFAGLNRSQVVADAQLESRWPVYQAVLHDGALAFVAGRHDTLDGGMLAWGLDPASGKPKWKIRLYTPMTKLEPGSKAKANDKGVVNGGVAVRAGVLCILSPTLAKSGSSPTKTGYFNYPKGQEFKLPGEMTSRATALDPVAMNGQTIRVVDLLPAKK